MPFEDPIDRYNRTYRYRPRRPNPNSVAEKRRKKRTRNYASGFQHFGLRDEFLEHAETDGNVYLDIETNNLVEFIRPCSDNPNGYRMRMKDIKTGARFSVDFLDLRVLSEMEVIALMTKEDSDENEAQG
jgi:hypothetical protein